MKVSEARSIAVKAQYAKISEKIEEACKEGLEYVECKNVLLFDEVLKQLVDDGFFVVRDYNTETATISWYEDAYNDEGEVRYIFTVVIEKEYEDEAVDSIEVIVTMDAGKKVLSYDDLFEIVQEEYLKEESEGVKELKSVEEAIYEKFEVVEEQQTKNGRIMVVKVNNEE